MRKMKRKPEAMVSEKKKKKVVVVVVGEPTGRLYS